MNPLGALVEKPKKMFPAYSLIRVRSAVRTIL